MIYISLDLRLHHSYPNIITLLLRCLKNSKFASVAGDNFRKKLHLRFLIGF